MYLTIDHTNETGQWWLGQTVYHVCGRFGRWRVTPAVFHLIVACHPRLRALWNEHLRHASLKAQTAAGAVLLRIG